MDLGLPDLGNINDSTVLCSKVIGWLQPDLVVSHDQFPARPVAKIFARRTGAILDLFSAPDSQAMQNLRCADRVDLHGRARCSAASIMGAKTPPARGAGGPGGCRLPRMDSRR